MTAPRRVADLTVEELERLVEAAAERAARRVRGHRDVKPENPAPRPTPERIERARSRLKRRGLLSPPGR